MYKQKLALTLGIITLAAVTAAPAAASTYTMTDLGSLGGRVSLGFGINASGEVVGRSYTTNVFFFSCGRHICRFTQNDPFSWIAGRMTDLGTLGARSMSEATAVNSIGDVVGGSNGQAFLVHNGKMTSLGPGTASGINDFGEIVGGTQGHAFLVSGGKLTLLPDPPGVGAGGAGASGINNNHQIVGSADDTSSNLHALMWSNGKVTDLGTLGGPQAVAYAINNNGQIVGSAQTSSDASHAFLYANGKMTDLGTFGLDPVPEAINNHGVIVGQSGNGAFIWKAGTFQALNNLIPPGSGFVLDDATAINDNGQIVANGHSTTNYQGHAFLLTPS